MRLRSVGLLLFGLAVAACAVGETASPSVFILDDVGIGRWRTVSTGALHGCALDADGRAFCWGSNEHRQLGVDEATSACGPAGDVPCSLVPVPIATGRSFASISAGASHTCAISTDSVPYCWGSNSDGQLGTTGAGSYVPRIPGSAPMIAISAGAAHSCGIRSDNQLVCWGSNRFGAVGAGGGTGVPPTLIGGAQRFASVHASDHRTCARTIAGRVMCWGAVWSHTSGDTNYTTIRPSPVFVAGLGTMTSVGVGPSSACAVDESGFGWCWESNVNGEGGAGPGPGTTTPHRVASDEEFTHVTVGAAHACAISAGGAAFCWGSNRSAQLGLTSPEFCGPARSPCATSPMRVAGRQRFISLSAGLGTHVCGISDQYNLYCWGSGSFGQRGDGTRSAASRIPRLAASLHDQ
jgi:alpha-tubulin suppressor-like RCC1 family protein